MLLHQQHKKTFQMFMVVWFGCNKKGPVRWGLGAAKAKGPEAFLPRAPSPKPSTVTYPFTISTSSSSGIAANSASAVTGTSTTSGAGGGGSKPTGGSISRSTYR